MDLNGKKAWKATLGELELSMTKGTFNTWIKDAKFIEQRENQYIIEVRNDYAQDWIENRLKETIERILSAVTTKESEIHVVTAKQHRSVEADTKPIEKEASPPPKETEFEQGEMFAGFSWPASNFTMTPDEYFDHTLRIATPTAFKAVGVIIRMTIGRRDKMGKWEEWVSLSISEIQKLSGTSSRKAVCDAIQEAIEAGWIKRQKVGKKYEYSMRFEGQNSEYAER